MRTDFTFKYILLGIIWLLYGVTFVIKNKNIF